jgi:hypothetical protein
MSVVLFALLGVADECTPRRVASGRTASGGGFGLGHQYSYYSIHATFQMVFYVNDNALGLVTTF